MEKKVVNIAILGIGTVGYATYTNLYKNRDIILNKTGFEINVSKILEKEPSLHKDKVHSGCVITSNFDEIVNDPNISIIVELIGGKTIAKEFVFKALEHGKHVVTANKALIAENAHEIFHAVAKSSASFFYEASVAGGIPIIAAIKQSFTGNQIKKIQSIVNGTCNFILTEMSVNGIDFPFALSDAQKKGYAEADPTFDIEGIDAAHKISILSALSFGKIIDFTSFKKIHGISKVTIHDIKIAQELGYEIRLIASTELTSKGLDIRVEPCMVNASHPLSSVSGPYNAVFVEGDPVGSTMFYGKGAGGNPTSSAVISDIITCTKDCVYGKMKHHLFYESMEEHAKIVEYGNKSKFSIRIWAKDKPGVLAKVASVLGHFKISIATVIQKLTSDTEYVPVFITTHESSEKNMQDAMIELSNVKIEANLKESPFVMRIID